MKKVLLTILLCIFVSAVCFAKSTSEIATLVKFSTSPISQNIDGLAITPLYPMGESEYMLTKLDPKLYYTNGVGYVGVSGVCISFANATNNVAIINWKESVLMINDVSYGMPLVGGMSYRDAGNPSATPNTIIPPKKTVSVNTYFPSPELYDGAWYQRPVKIPKKGFVTFFYYLSVTINGKTSYVNVDVPKIYIPEEDILTKSKK